MVTHAYIRSLGKTTGAILREALLKFPADVNQKNSRNTLAETLREILQETVDQPFITILDDADNLHDHDAIGVLQDVQQASVVAICHNPQE